jgi:hypothetical protein
MGTPCLVGVQDPATGEIHYIYIQFDGGYRDAVGQMLMDNYATYEEAKALVACGNLRFLCDTLANTRARNPPCVEEESVPKTCATVADYCAAIKRQTRKGYLFTVDHQWAMRKGKRWFTEARSL